MEANSHDLDAVISAMMEQGFPELSRCTITGVYNKEKGALFSYARSGECSYEITVRPKLRKVSLPVLRGGLAHELSHISRDSQRTRLGFLIDKQLYDRFSRYRTRDERATDLLVIERGFGDDLLAFITYHDKNYKKFNQTDGLTKKEIKKILSAQVA